MKRSKIKFVLLVLTAVLFFAGISSGQAKDPPHFYIADTAVNRISKANNILPLWIGAHAQKAESVRVFIPYVISSEGEHIKFQNSVAPEYYAVLSDTMAHPFNAAFNTGQFRGMKSGKYTAVVIISSKNVPELRQYIPVYIKAPATVYSVLLTILADGISLFLSALEMIVFAVVFILVVIFAIRFFRKLLLGKKTISIQPVADETGNTGLYGGIASGIDDLLQANIQDILRLMTKVCRSISSGLKTQDESAMSERSTGINLFESAGPRYQAKSGKKSLPINISIKSEDIDLQKVGEIGVGIFKVPLGSLAVMLSKIFGGYYVRGALQKFGPSNKLILSLEKRSALLQKKSVTLFEGVWESVNLAEGILPVIEELSYRIVMEISEEFKNVKWKAYKHFLAGNVLFSEYEENNLRKDKLRDAISQWEESIRLDHNFAEAHYNLGVALDRDNKITDALSRYNKTVTSSADKKLKVKAYINMLMIYILDLLDIETARALLKKVKSLKVRRAELYNLEGLLIMNEKNAKGDNASGKAENNDAVEKAVKCFKRAILYNKLHRIKAEPLYHYNLSYLYYIAGNYTDAEKYGMKAYRLYSEPERPVYLLHTLGAVYYEKKEYQKSLKFFEEGLLLEPDNRDLLYNYSLSLLHLKPGRSLSAIRRLLLRHPGDSAGCILMSEIIKVTVGSGKAAEAYKTIGEELSKFNDAASAHASLPDSYALLEEGSFAQALYAAAIGGILYYMPSPDYVLSAGYLEIAVSSADKDFEKLFLPEALLVYGKALIKGEDYVAAIAALKKASELYEELNSKQPYYDYEMAVCLDHLGEAYADEALKYDEKYLKEVAAVKNILPKNELEEVAKKETDFNFKADAAFSKSILHYRNLNMNFQASDIYVKRAQWLTAVKAYNYKKEANADCDQAINLDPNNYNAFHSKGNIFYYSQNDAEAIFQYEQAAEIYFDAPWTHYQIGICHTYQGNYDKAVKSFRTALKLKRDYAAPDDFHNPDAYQALARALSSLMKYEEAEKALIEAVNLYPLKLKYRLLLARTYISMDKFSEAEEELKTGLQHSVEGSRNFRHLALNDLADIELDYGADYVSAGKKIKDALAILESKGELDETANEDLALLQSTQGWAYYRMNRFKEAEKLLESTQSFFIGDAKVHSRLARLYEKESGIAGEKSQQQYYKEKALGQWNLVIKFAAKDDLRKLAEEHIAALKKADSK